MPRLLRLTRAARRDLVGVRKWETQHGAGALARVRLERVQQAVLDLEQHPCSWPRSIEHPGRRRRVVGKYVIIYRVDPDTGDNASAGNVTILRIFGPGQQLVLS